MEQYGNETNINKRIILKLVLENLSARATLIGLEVIPNMSEVINQSRWVIKTGEMSTEIVFCTNINEDLSMETRKLVTLEIDNIADPFHILPRPVHKIVLKVGEQKRRICSCFEVRRIKSPRILSVDVCG